MTRPVLVEAETPFLHIQNMIHPCLMKEDFVPNDIDMGIEQPNIWLLTGPNMGGKSTLLRQVCINVIIAQIGCFVPSSNYKGTVVDRIFTRIGASDNIFENQSTFMVESRETSDILNNFTKNSLIILDELGRGTSTFDGYAIAFSVLTYLSKNPCRAFFSTHYHALTEDFQNNDNISLRYMDALVNEERGEVVFLYKVLKGACPKSHGMKVALMAGIPPQLVDYATTKSNEMESSSSLEEYKNRQKLKSFKEKLTKLIVVLNQNNKENLLQLWKKLK